MVNTLLFQLIILQTLNCQALNNLCLCLSYSIFVLQSQLTGFSAILRQQQTDNTSWLVSRQKRGLERGQLQNNCPLFVWENQCNFMQSVISLTTKYHTLIHIKRCKLSQGTCLSHKVKKCDLKVKLSFSCVELGLLLYLGIAGRES